MGQEANEMANRDAIGEATNAIRDLQALLNAESCLATVEIDTDGRSLRWGQHGPNRKWLVLAESGDTWEPLLGLPALDRIAAYRYLPKLADKARAAMADAIKRAGLGDAR